jgi:hypothetical protein
MATNFRELACGLLLDALFYSVEEKGSSIGWASEGEAVLKIQVDGELIRPILAEISDQNGYVLTEKEFAQRKKISILILRTSV